jgi:hypothetical protein
MIGYVLHELVVLFSVDFVWSEQLDDRTKSAASKNGAILTAVVRFEFRENAVAVVTVHDLFHFGHILLVVSNEERTVDNSIIQAF